jgi:hypothetical protein
MLRFSKKFFLLPIFVLLLVFVLYGCSTAARTISVYSAGPGVTQYYIPSTDWKADKIKVKLDITYRHELDSPAVCNFSLTGKGQIPPAVSAGSFTGDGVSYPLTDLSVIFANSSKKTLRMSSKIAQGDFLALLNARSLTFLVVAGGEEYRCTPPKQFYTNKDQLAANVSYQLLTP